MVVPRFVTPRHREQCDVAPLKKICIEISKKLLTENNRVAIWPVALLLGQCDRIGKTQKMADKRTVSEMRKDFNTILSVMKTDGGRLTAAGVAFVEQGLKDKIPKKTLANLLDITPSAVTYRAHR